eukprot:14233577-Heterocapsa_arctica.AAC.1
MKLSLLPKLQTRLPPSKLGLALSLTSAGDRDTNGTYQRKREITTYGGMLCRIMTTSTITPLRRKSPTKTSSRATSKMGIACKLTACPTQPRPSR